MLSLYRATPEVGLVKKVTRKFVLVGATALANPMLPHFLIMNKLQESKFVLVGGAVCANHKPVLPHSLIIHLVLCYSSAEGNQHFKRLL